MKKVALFFAPLAVLLIVALPSYAETQYRFEVFGAGTIPVKKHFEISAPQSSVPLSGEQQFSFGARGGVRLGTDGKGRWGQDFIYSFGTNATKIVNQTNGSQFSFTSRVHQFSYNVLWYPHGSGLDKKSGAFPYVTGGVGGSFHVLSQAAINQALDPSRAGLGQLHNENVFDFNAGGGVRVKLNPRYGVRVDARDFMSRAVRYGLPQSSSDPTATVFPISGVFHRIEASVGFVIYF
jgi:hypothetical protein